MRTVFADTFYWISLANPRDDWHQAARRAAQDLVAARIVTTDEVLTEFLTFCCRFGPGVRSAAAQIVRHLLSNSNVTVVPQSRDSFLTGLQLYEARSDKKYSLTDCISMESMREHGLTEVLTNDHHFEQEGFVILFPGKP